MKPIAWADIPEDAKSFFSSRQQSYIDEFRFFRCASGNILVRYCELMYVWNGSTWLDYYTLTRVSAINES